jgi:hypothetical protein
MRLAWPDGDSAKAYSAVATNRLTNPHVYLRFRTPHYVHNR